MRGAISQSLYELCRDLTMFRDQRAHSRRGMSFLEVFGCLSAMIGGVVLGSLYLGVDVKATVMSVLTHAQVGSTAKPELAEKPAAKASSSPASAPTSPAAPVAVESAVASTAPGTTAVESPKSEEQKVAVVDTTSPGANAAVTIATVAEAEAAPAADAAPAEIDVAPAFADVISLTDEQRRAVTLAYWKGLEGCMKDEVDNRLSSIDDSGNWQIYDFLTSRKEGHQRASERLAKLNLRGVDPHVSAYAVKALAWHRDGVKLFSRSLDLLTDAPTAQLTGPFAQSWQSASTQHRMEERLLGEKHQAVQSYLDHGTRIADEAASQDAE